MLPVTMESVQTSTRRPFLDEIKQDGAVKIKKFDADKRLSTYIVGNY
jgi:hypothetical protein